MPKLQCSCGYVHNLSAIPDEGWLTIRDQDYEQLINREVERADLEVAPEEAQNVERLIVADAEVVSKIGLLYECPQCGTILWQKPNASEFKVYSPIEYFPRAAS